MTVSFCTIGNYCQEGKLNRLTSPNISIRNNTKGLEEHIGEAFGFGRFSCIPTVHCFVHIGLQITLAHEVICTENHSLELSPKAFNGIGGDSVLRELQLRMVDILVGIVLIQAVVTTAFIGEDNGIVSTKLLNVCTEGFCLGIRHYKCCGASCTLRHSEDSGFSFEGLSLRMLSLLALMLVLLPTAKVHFVTFNLTFKGNGIILCIEAANLMENELSGFLSCVDIPCQLSRRYTFLVATYKIHSHKPLDKADFGILKDSTYGDCEGTMTVGTDILTVLACVAMMLSAIGAHHITVSPTGLSDSLLTFGGVIKVEGNVYKRIEVSEVNHNKSYVLGISI